MGTYLVKRPCFVKKVCARSLSVKMGVVHSPLGSVACSNRPFDVQETSSGQKFDCSCGQRLQIPPAPLPPPNKTLLGKMDDQAPAALPFATAIPAPVPDASPISDASAPEKPRPRFECPYCHTHEKPEYVREMSLIGWILVIPAVLSCVGLIIWLCCLEMLKEPVQRCYKCGMRLSERW
jgi:hypothetical protein